MLPGLKRQLAHAQVPGLPVSGRMYLQTVTPSFAAGAGGTAPGGGGRRLLEAGPGRGLLQAAATNQSTAAGEAAIVIAGLNAVLSSNTGRKLLQTPGTGLEILYACAPRLQPLVRTAEAHLSALRPAACLHPNSGHALPESPQGQHTMSRTCLCIPRAGQS